MHRKNDMQRIFEDDFRAQPDGAAPHGWEIERHADLFHDLSEIRAGALRILFPGNLHLPLIPPLRTGRLLLTIRRPGLNPADVQCDCAWRLVEKHADYLRLGLALAPHASAHLVIGRRLFD